ncbi:MAG: asparagine synthetase B [Cyclobacteriaceae bacterium]|nr:asparagine synthetase B [Cyclobacteriaceae bacterium]
MKWVFTVWLSFVMTISYSGALLIPMDDTQKNHLKAYGIAFFTLQQNQEVNWLLNYRGGSFLIDATPLLENECTVRGVTVEKLTAIQVNSILQQISSPNVNMDVIKLEKAPRIAVYSPKNEFITDDTDAVIAVLNYAEIPFLLLYDEEVLKDELVKYDWLHLHHEDFTGQHERFLRGESSVIESKFQETLALRLGYTTVPEMKLAVAKKIKVFCNSGGYLFAMCSAAETLDIALASDISTAMESNAEEEYHLDFSKTFAFENFSLEESQSRRFSDINSGRNFYGSSKGYFTLFSFSAKWDVIPTLLTQNHTQVIKEFTGLTTAFNKAVVKPDVLILGESRTESNVRYIYGEMGNGHWTFYGGHDPEGSPGRGRASTDLNTVPHSPGYRLILNNVLFPSARRKKQKT